MISLFCSLWWFGVHGVVNSKSCKCNVHSLISLVVLFSNGAFKSCLLEGAWVVHLVFVLDVEELLACAFISCEYFIVFVVA